MPNSTSSMNIVKSDYVNKKLYVRYMLSLRCKNIVKAELKKLEISHIRSPYGAIEFTNGIEKKQIKTLKRSLNKFGLDLLNHYESMLVDKIINTITEVIHEFDDLPNVTFSEIISRNLSDASESVLKIFTEVVGMSVVQFIVLHKVDRIKEHLLYDDYSLSEISDMLKYKSEHHLIAQFKKYTGLTPAHFRDLGEVRTKIISQNMQAANEEKSFKNKPVG